MIRRPLPSILSFASSTASNTDVDLEYFGKFVKNDDFSKIHTSIVNVCKREGCTLPKKMIKELESRINRAKKNDLKPKLDFSSCDIGDAQLRCLLEALAPSPMIVKLELKNNKITNQGAKYILQFLETQSNLVRETERDRRLTVNFLGKVVFEKSSNSKTNSIGDIHMSDIKKYTEALDYINAQSYIRSKFLKLDGQEIISIDFVRIAWAHVFGSSPRGTQAQDMVTSYARRYKDLLVYEEFELAFLQQLQVSHKLATLSIAQYNLINISPPDSSRLSGAVPRSPANSSHYNVSVNENDSPSLRRNSHSSSGSMDADTWKDDSDPSKSSSNNRRPSSTSTSSPSARGHGHARKQSYGSTSGISVENDQLAKNELVASNEKPKLSEQPKLSEERPKFSLVPKLAVQSSTPAVARKEAPQKKELRLFESSEASDVELNVSTSDEESMASMPALTGLAQNVKAKKRAEQTKSSDSRDIPSHSSPVPTRSSTTPTATAPAPAKASLSPPSPLSLPSEPANVPKEVTPLEKESQNISNEEAVKQTSMLPTPTAPKETDAPSKGKEEVKETTNELPPLPPPPPPQLPKENIFNLKIDTTSNSKFHFSPIVESSIGNYDHKNTTTNATTTITTNTNLPSENDDTPIIMDAAVDDVAMKEEIVADLNHSKMSSKIPIKTAPSVGSVFPSRKEKQKEVRQENDANIVEPIVNKPAQYLQSSRQDDTQVQLHLMQQSELLQKLIAQQEELSAQLQKQLKLQEDQNNQLQRQEKMIAQTQQDFLEQAAMTTTTPNTRQSSASPVLRRRSGGGSSGGRLPLDFPPLTPHRNRSPSRDRDRDRDRRSTSSSNNNNNNDDLMDLMTSVQTSNYLMTPVSEGKKKKSVTPRRRGRSPGSVGSLEYVDRLYPSSLLNTSSTTAASPTNKIKYRSPKASAEKQQLVLSQNEDTCIDLQGSDLETIPNMILVSNISKIQSLILRNNRITNIDCRSFECMPALTYLDVSHNSLSTVTGKFPNSLLRLDLSHNRLQTVPGLILCSKLSYLDISHNLLFHVDQLPMNITHLNLSRNILSTELDLRLLSLCAKISSLSIDGNPITEMLPNYRVRLISLLPQLAELNGNPLPKARLFDTPKSLEPTSAFSQSTSKQSNKGKKTNTKKTKEEQEVADNKRHLQYLKHEEKISRIREDMVLQFAKNREDDKSSRKSSKGAKVVIGGQTAGGLTPAQIEEVINRLSKTQRPPVRSVPPTSTPAPPPKPVLNRNTFKKRREDELVAPKTPVASGPPVHQVMSTILNAATPAYGATPGSQTDSISPVTMTDTCVSISVSPPDDSHTQQSEAVADSPRDPTSIHKNNGSKEGVAVSVGETRNPAVVVSGLPVTDLSNKFEAESIIEKKAANIIDLEQSQNNGVTVNVVDKIVPVPVPTLPESANMKGTEEIDEYDAIMSMDLDRDLPADNTPSSKGINNVAVDTSPIPPLPKTPSSASVLDRLKARLSSKNTSVTFGTESPPVATTTITTPIINKPSHDDNQFNEEDPNDFSDLISVEEYDDGESDSSPQQRLFHSPTEKFQLRRPTLRDTYLKGREDADSTAAGGGGSPYEKIVRRLSGSSPTSTGNVKEIMTESSKELADSRRDIGDLIGNAKSILGVVSRSASKEKGLVRSDSTLSIRSVGESSKNMKEVSTDLTDSCRGLRDIIDNVKDILRNPSTSSDDSKEVFDRDKEINKIKDRRRCRSLNSSSRNLLGGLSGTSSQNSSSRNLLGYLGGTASHNSSSRNLLGYLGGTASHNSSSRSILTGFASRNSSSRNLLLGVTDKTDHLQDKALGGLAEEARRFQSQTPPPPGLTETSMQSNDSGTPVDLQDLSSSSLKASTMDIKGVQNTGDDSKEHQSRNELQLQSQATERAAAALAVGSNSIVAASPNVNDAIAKNDILTTDSNDIKIEVPRTKRVISKIPDELDLTHPNLQRGSWIEEPLITIDMQTDQDVGSVDNNGSKSESLVPSHSMALEALLAQLSKHQQQMQEQEQEMSWAEDADEVMIGSPLAPQGNAPPSFTTWLDEVVSHAPLRPASLPRTFKQREPPPPSRLTTTQTIKSGNVSDIRKVFEKPDSVQEKSSNTVIGDRDDNSRRFPSRLKPPVKPRFIIGGNNTLNSSYMPHDEDDAVDAGDRDGGRHQIDLSKQAATTRQNLSLVGSSTSIVSDEEVEDDDDAEKDSKNKPLPHTYWMEELRGKLDIRNALKKPPA